VLDDLIGAAAMPVTKGGQAVRLGLQQGVGASLHFRREGENLRGGQLSAHVVRGPADMGPAPEAQGVDGVVQGLSRTDGPAAPVLQIPVGNSEATSANARARRICFFCFSEMRPTLMMSFLSLPVPAGSARCAAGATGFGMVTTRSRMNSG
jgi:hypothetical protein